MAFKDRLRDMRVQAGITQKGLASAVGITERSIQNYELGTRKPNNMEVVQKIADALHTTTEYLLGSEETFVIEAHEKGGAKSARDVNELVSEVTALFAGGTLDENAKEGVMAAITVLIGMRKRKTKNIPRRSIANKSPLYCTVHRVSYFLVKGV